MSMITRVTENDRIFSRAHELTCKADGRCTYRIIHCQCDKNGGLNARASLSLGGGLLSFFFFLCQFVNRIIIAILVIKTPGHGRTVT